MRDHGTIRRTFMVVGLAGLGCAAAVHAQSASLSDTLAPGHVWECTTDGQRVFSDKPCGTDARIRELSPVNTMQAETRDEANASPPYARSASAVENPASNAGETDRDADDAFAAGSYETPDEASSAQIETAPLPIYYGPLYYGGAAPPRRFVHPPRHVHHHRDARPTSRQNQGPSAGGRGNWRPSVPPAARNQSK